MLLLEHMVKIKEQTLTEDYLARLASQHSLAIACGANEQFKERLSQIANGGDLLRSSTLNIHFFRLLSLQSGYQMRTGPAPCKLNQ